jgi:signal transduction histidine kinase
VKTGITAEVCFMSGVVMSRWNTEMASAEIRLTGEAISGGGLGMIRPRSFYILLSLFALCTLLYYFGELIDFAGWTALRWEFFYGVHDVQRLLFLAPIIYAGHAFRVKGAVVVTLASFIAFLPRAFLVSPFPDPMLRIALFTVAAGFMGSFIGVIRNEAERRSHLEALVRSERDKLLGIFERMEDGVMIVGPDYRIRFVNSSMEREFGEGIGSSCYEYLHNFDDPCEQICKLPSVVNGATERWEYGFPDGRTYEVIASPFVDSDGEVCQLATFRNITQRKQVELELIELDKLKSELLSNVSHELRSPLTSIKGITSSLLQKDIELDDETQEMLLSGVSEETDRLASLVTKLLDMSKLEAGVWKPEKERCYISDIINETLEHEKWVHKNRSFETDLEPDTPEIYADCSQIRQVLVNLVENAAAYSNEGTKITVRAETSDGDLEVSVSDEGVGIPQEDLEKIFDKFYRGAQKRHKPGGTGLGLAICQAIVLSHGGRIWAESEIGHGSTFHFTLPVARPSND